MSNLLKIIVLTLVFQNNILYSQFIKTEKEIAVAILYKQIENGETDFYLSCYSPKTFFSKEVFLEEVSLKNIPENVLIELVKNSKEISKDDYWACDLLKMLNFPEDYFKLKECIKKKMINAVLKNNKRNTIFEISRPLFDKSKTHCIVKLVTIKRQGEFTSRSFFLKKVYGKWVIIEEYNLIIS